MRSFSDEALAAHLTGGQIPLKVFYLVGEPTCRLIEFWLPDLGPRMILMDDNELASACKDYLVRIGARQFRDESEVAQAAEQEQWPGWESNAWRFRPRRRAEPGATAGGGRDPGRG